MAQSEVSSGGGSAAQCGVAVSSACKACGCRRQQWRLRRAGGSGRVKCCLKLGGSVQVGPAYPPSPISFFYVYLFHLVLLYSVLSSFYIFFCYVILL